MIDTERFHRGQTLHPARTGGIHMKYKKEELIPEVVKARIAEARLKKLQGEWGWFGNSE